MVYSRPARRHHSRRAMLTRMPPLKSRVIPGQAAEPKLSQIEARAEYSSSQWNDLPATRHIDLPTPYSPFVSVHRTEYSGDRYTKTDSLGIIRTWLKWSWSKCIGREYCTAVVKDVPRTTVFSSGWLIEISRKRLFSLHGELTERAVKSPSSNRFAAIENFTFWSELWCAFKTLAGFTSKCKRRKRGKRSLEMRGNDKQVREGCKLLS